MSKDPAVLFYTSDFISGTITMSDEQRGQYILLLCLQHQKGFLYEKDMLKICGKMDVEILDKFKQTKDGKYYNERMKLEADKRKKYSESRSNNRKGSKKDKKNICKSYDKHMENENEIINESKPTINDFKKYFQEKGYKEEVAEQAFNYYENLNWHDSKGTPIKNWKNKCVNVWFKPENKIPPKQKMYNYVIDKVGHNKAVIKSREELFLQDCEMYGRENIQIVKEYEL